MRDYLLRLTFSDGVLRELDLEAELWGQMFEPLKDIEYFKQVRVEPDFSTIVWPNGADIAPEFPYALVLGSTTPTLLEKERLSFA